MTAEYLRKSSWPECIDDWGEITHDHDGRDDYPHAHPKAASIGESYLGDVCPWCGVPLSWNETVVLTTGERGPLHEVDELGDPTPAYHPECWAERRGYRIVRLDEI